MLKTFDGLNRSLLHRLVTGLDFRHCNWRFRLVGVCLAAALLLASLPASLAWAQSSDDPWDAPLNLSHSGVAVNPSIVIDSQAVVHAVWQDDLGNFEYSRLDGDQWSEPEMTDLNRLFRMPAASESRDQSQPVVYTGSNPLFIASPSQYIFAFWISPQGKLFTSKVTNRNFQHVSAWDSGSVVASDVASFAVAVDTRGEWHLAYFRTIDAPKYPAGMYYTRSRNSGWNWAVPVLLYESPYLRRLGEGEANLSIATAETEDVQRVYIAWDNRPRKQVLLAQSADGGESWEQPVVVAGPVPDPGLAEPFNIHVGANQKSVVLVWRNGRPEGSCSQIYQSSSDAGTTWSDPQPMINGLLGCGQPNEFVKGLANNSAGRLYFMTETQSQIYLSAWNGTRWSEPHEQPALDGFEDPEIFTNVDYGCHRASLLGERLYIIGCDQGEGGDVWVTSRALESDTSWFEASVWSELSPVTSDNLEVETLEVVATDDGFIHAFFSQYQDSVIYYTYWDGQLWSNITPVLKVSDGDTGFSAIAGPGNELFLIALSNRGALFFSRALSGTAATESHWSTPTQLAIGHDGEIGSVDVAWDTAGTLYLAYSVPVNEERGIYLVQSKDQGTSWSEPLQVFNGAVAGFDLVGAPSLLISEDGSLHVIWKQQSIQGDGALHPRSLYYTRSENGQTFTAAEVVVEEPVAWRDIVTDNNGNLHLLWQPQDPRTTVWDQVSLDGGQMWQYPQGLPDEGGLAAVTKDAAGRLHFLGLGQGALGHWLWDDNRWQSEAPLEWPLSSQQEIPVELLGAAINKQGKMMVVLAEPTGEGDAMETTLRYSVRALELPLDQTAIQDTSTQTLIPSTSIPATPSPELSSTPASMVESKPTNSPDQADLNQTNNRISPFTLALVPVALLLLLVLGVVIRRATRAEDR